MLFKSTRIRTRLLIAYLGIILLGFGSLTIVAGQQISSAARIDYEQRMANEVQLIAQGISSYLIGETNTDTLLESLLEEYEDQTDGELTLLEIEPFSARQISIEIERAIRGEVVVVSRVDVHGDDALHTAAPIVVNRHGYLVVHLSVPMKTLETIVWQRWATLGLIVGLVAALAVIASLLLSHSIIHPLYELRESALQLSRGDFSHRVDYHQDDEIGEVARAFNEMAQEVESMLKEQRAFASNTSHELRTPLTTIRLRTDALRYDPTLDETTSRQYIVEIDDEVRRLTSLIEDLTLLSRLDAGRAVLGHEEIDMGRFATSLYQRLHPQAEARRIRLSLVVPDEIVPVHASLNHLTIVFRNLLDNAIKYTPNGGAIAWHINAKPEGISSVIADSGIGISSDQLPHIFERFYRADKARSREVPGSGLGLAIVKSIVEAYHGSITITSGGTGKGTQATVIWPHSSPDTKSD